ncbi:hypothetical protein NE237_011706 [Protea cynaroides]|uniref:Hepcidin n=1 Tax=Protea cynaroides TaxID=273540 RepID=A0A9Q0GYE3_9MAGN|nr:hypothetical protein NE237_011706 [Protea cynaroides]
MVLIFHILWSSFNKESQAFVRQRKKMGSRTLLLLGLAMAFFLLISSEVVARDLVETSDIMMTMQKKQATKMDEIDDSKVPRSPPPISIPRIPRGRSLPPIGCLKGCCAQVGLACLDCC